MPLALTTAIAWLRATRWAQYALLGIVVVLAIVLAIRAYNASVIDDYEQERTARSVRSLDMAAEERAADAINNAIANKERIDVIDQAPESGPLPESTVRHNCLRLQRAGVRLPEPCRRRGFD